MGVVVKVVVVGGGVLFDFTSCIYSPLESNLLPRRCLFVAAPCCYGNVNRAVKAWRTHVICLYGH